MLASFLLNASIAFCALSNNVAPSIIFCAFGFTIPFFNIAGMMSDCKCCLKNSFCAHAVSKTFENYTGCLAVKRKLELTSK